MTTRPIAVLGAGNVGLAMSAFLAHRGQPVHVALGKLTGVATPIIRATVDYACTLNARDWWSEGTSIEALGLTDLASLKRRVMEGE